MLIVILARLLAAGFRKIKQPPVIGEILAGLLLGTSLLGQFHYDGNKPLTQALFPTAVVPSSRSWPTSVWSSTCSSSGSNSTPS